MYSGARSTSTGKFEESSFPVLCEECLGEEEQLRMMKSPFDNACKLCSRPFTTFRWRPGGRGKFFTTEICQTCAKLRNACQACVLDLVYKLPVQIRDKITGDGVTAPPVQTNEVHREYFADQAERKIASGQHSGSEFAKAPPMPKLVGVARTMTPYFRAMGLDSHADVSVDPNNKSLFVGGVPEEASEANVRAALESFGAIESVRLVRKSRCAFVDFVERSGANAAFIGSGGTVVVESLSKEAEDGRAVCSVHWSKGRRRGAAQNDSEAQKTVVPPPPGVNLKGRTLGATAPAAASYYPSASGRQDGSAPTKR